MIDQGQNDPLPFDLTGWNAVADAIKKHIEAEYGRELTEIQEAA